MLLTHLAELTGYTPIQAGHTGNQSQEITSGNCFVLRLISELDDMCYSKKWHCGLCCKHRLLAKMLLGSLLWFCWGYLCDWLLVYILKQLMKWYGRQLTLYMKNCVGNSHLFAWSFEIHGRQKVFIWNDYYRIFLILSVLCIHTYFMVNIMNGDMVGFSVSNKTYHMIFENLDCWGF